MASNGIISATLWSSIQRFGGLAISFVSNMVLARLLSPDDFGVMGLIMVFVVVADVLVDGGLGNALIQKKELVEKDKTTIFTANLFFSFCLFGLLFLLAPFLEKVTEVPGFALLLRVQAVCVLIRAFYVINVAEITRNLNYQHLANIALISQFSSTLISIIMAYNGMGVWSLLWKTILLDFFCCLLYAIVSPFRYKISFDKGAFRGLFSFGFPVALANIIESLYSNIVSFIIGKAYSVKDLGYFNQANSLKQIPVYSVSSVINQVFFPFFSRIQDDSDALKNKFQKTIKVVTFFIYPLLSFLIFFAEPVITLFYSEKWVPCVPIFQVLCLSGFFNSLYHLSRSTIKALGKSKLLLYTQFFIVIISLIFVAFFLQYSILTFVWVVVIDAVISYSVVGFYVGKDLRYSLFCQFRDFGFTMVLSLVVAYGSLQMSGLCELPMIANTILFFVVNILLYFAVSLILRNEVSVMTLGIIRAKFIK